MNLNNKLRMLCESAINEGAGAAVTFHFDEKDRDYKIDVDYDAKGLEIKVSNLLITDYYHSNKAYDGGKFVFSEDDLKEAVVKDNNDYSEDKIKKEDIKSVEIVGVEEMPNLTCSWGWVRSDIPDEMIITEQSNDYYAVLQVDAQIGDVKTMYTVEVDGKYIPSDEVKVAYDNLGEDDDDFDMDESVDEHTEIKCRVYARMLEKINEKFGTLIGTFKIEPLYTDKYELGLKRGYGRYDFKFVSDDAFLPLKNKSLEEQAEYLKGLILGKE